MALTDWIQWIIKASSYIGLSALAGGVVLLYACQNSLIYPANFPAGSRTVVATPDEHGMPEYEAVTITTPDQVKIQAYYIPHHTGGLDSSAAAEAAVDGLRHRTAGRVAGGKVANTTVLFCHANAGNMGHRLPIAKVFHTRFRTNVVMFSYRGYGHSEGSPSEKGMKIDAQAALDWTLAHPQLKHTKVIVYGQSIGGAVAINLAANNQETIAALIVENTFLTLRKLIPSVMPLIRHFTFLCHQIWDSETAIASIPRMPILLLSGGRDELIPSQQMLALCCAARNARRRKGERKIDGSEATFETDSNGVRFVRFPSGTHNETCVQPGYFDAIFAFWSSFVAVEGVGKTDVASPSVPKAESEGTTSSGLAGVVKVVRQGGASASL
ncbi:hypothetical protein HDU87_006897 [Geranomyces variabilis]|uniref:AB hydrolase-1 domain-containing protein n=1 Tax=Geranomyces variabilis TaxID=109894 RepID=A0AAD5XK48_9FUNG|nr:hypothetical protein HDU87_006897 [Geranomyces variabilis]